MRFPIFVVTIHAALATDSAVPAGSKVTFVYFGVCHFRATFNRGKRDDSRMASSIDSCPAKRILKEIKYSISSSKHFAPT